MTDRFFDVLGARPLLGRVFREGDDKPGALQAIVLSHTFWIRRFRGDPAVVGRTVAIDGVSHSIVGVMPAGFRFPQDEVDVWRTLTMKTPTGRAVLHDRGRPPEG